MSQGCAMAESPRNFYGLPLPRCRFESNAYKISFCNLNLSLAEKLADILAGNVALTFR